MELTYSFEKMSNGMFQVRLCGEFVCYSTHTNETGIDDYLKAEGYSNRKEYLDVCLEDIEENF